MPYSILTDILDRIPEQVVIQLTDEAGAGELDADKVDDAIRRADREIDAWCGKRYSVPFATVPDIVAELSVDMAIYFLYSRNLEEVPETRKETYKNAVKLLQAIGRGEVSLGVDPAPAAPTGSGASFSGGERRFSRDTLKDM